MGVKRIPFAVIGILLVLLVAFLFGSACADDGYNEPFFSTPYPLKKLADFQFYKSNGLSLSHAAELNPELFTGSIKANSAIQGYGDIEQRYNYAIDSKKARILVAVWNEDVDSRRLREVASSAASVTSNLTLDPPKGMMINWHPESLKPPQSPCWFPARVGTHSGLLDAESKHFMLAQGPGTTINDYNPGWANTEVRYAGEIRVYIKDCKYTVDGESGTYAPERTTPIQQDLDTYFAKVLGVAPGAMIPGGCK